MRPSRRRNPPVAHSIVLRGHDRQQYLDEIWPQLVRTYMESTGIVPHSSPDELLKDYAVWDVYFHDDGRVASFVLSKETPYGLKHAASGHDGSRDGKDTAKDVLRRGFHAPGVYGETSHGVEHVAAKGDPPVVCSVNVKRVLGKDIQRSRDGIHYTRTITGVGPVEKVMLGRPVGIETTRYSEPSCPIPPDAELVANPRRRGLRGRPPRMNPAIDLAPYRGKSAKQLVALVKKHRKTVDAAKELERGRKLLAKHGYKTDKRLGSGQAATVYTLIDYPKYVAKLTHDPLDAAVMSEVQVLGVRPGLPDVVGVADLGNNLYGIILERLLPLTEAEDALVETLGEQTAFGREADDTVWKYYAKKPRQLELLEAAKTVRALGFTPTDIGAGNVMKRANGSWVVSDLGFSKPSSSVRTRDIPRFQNPRAQNPRPAPARRLRRNSSPHADWEERLHALTIAMKVRSIPRYDQQTAALIRLALDYVPPTDHLWTRPPPSPSVPRSATNEDIVRALQVAGRRHEADVATGRAGPPQFDTAALARAGIGQTRRNPEDAGVIRDLLARLQEFKYAVMEAAGDDPYDTPFDPHEYPISKYTLLSYLDAPILGFGATRVVVRLPSGNVAKLLWSDDISSNEDEWNNWQQASPEVRRMLLPPLEYVEGVLVYPHVETVEGRGYDDPDLVAARARWARLWNARAPGANASDFQRNANWGIYDGRLVLIDYAD